MGPVPPASLLEAAFIVLVALVTGLLAASYVWSDPRYRREAGRGRSRSEYRSKRPTSERSRWERGPCEAQQSGPPSLAQRVAETLFAAIWLALAAGAAAWAILLFIAIARVNPFVIPVVLLGLYLLMAVHVAWEQFRRHGGILGALLVGIFWLPLSRLLRRV